MYKDKEELVKKIENAIGIVSGKQSILRNYTEELSEKYNLPMQKIQNVLSLKTSLLDESDFIVYCFADVILDPSEDFYKVDKWYTKDEIKTYSNTKIKEEKIKFPIVFKMIQIDDERADQWIGRTSFQELIKFRNAQLINYNENTQRTMQHIINGGRERFRITLNRKAVQEISQSYNNGTFIPNTITLNMPEDTKYYYENGELVIEKLRYFDILDGYHRYIAGSNEINLNPDFDYSMELRIVSFPESRARQFIYQEDQKTKMKKIDSDSMNMNSYSNKIVTYLNSSPLCNISGLISNNDGIVNYAYLSQMINDFYFKGLTNKKAQELWIGYRKEIEDKINLITSQDQSLMNGKWKWDYVFTLAVVYVFKNGEVDIENIRRFYNTLKENKEKYGDIWIRKVSISGPSLMRLNKIYREL